MTPLIHKISGPPGTGKSTTLLNVVDELLTSGVAPENIVFTTFTRAGAYEARDRACARFKLDQKRLPYFRTLHSLCFHLTGKCEVMQNSDWCQIAKTLGMAFTLHFGNMDETIVRGHTKGDFLLNLWSLARVQRVSLKHIYNHREEWHSGFHNVSYEEFDHFVRSINNYKHSHGKIDFTDMLERYLASDIRIDARYIIVDEAQDLSQIQWEVIERLYQPAEKVWIAGDDDQAIHEWNGASPDHFRLLPSEGYTVLPQSYRIPASVHTIAESIIQKVIERLPKVYLPRPDHGRVHRVSDLERVNLSGGTYLLLARNLCFLDQYVQVCRRQGVLYRGAGLKVSDEEVLGAINSWKRISGRDSISAREGKVMFRFMSQRDRIKRSYKKKLEEAPDELVVDYYALTQNFGLICRQDMHWSQALDMLPANEISFLKAVEKRGNLDKEPQIEISTIHGAKGKEADHVVLMLDMAPLTYRAWCIRQDPEHRTFYVGVTRCRENLYLLDAKTDMFYPI